MHSRYLMDLLAEIGWRSSLTDMYFGHMSVLRAKGTALIMKGTIADLKNRA